MPSIFEPQDSAPSVSVHPDQIRDAVPRAEQVTRAGNKNPYTVNGKTYHLLPTAKGYEAEGIASWYGTKFHGRNTANGERYNLYGMTAAHKTLPIPSYVRVTNLNNGRTAVVRVNDRGPFKAGRIIDLSYAAAVKLGYAKQGTTRVRIEAIDPSAPPGREVPKRNVPGDTVPGQKVQPQPAPVLATTAPKPVSAAPQVASEAAQARQYFLQVGAFKSRELANKLRAEVILTTNQAVTIATGEPEGFYRVQVGPLDGMSKVQALSDLLVESGLGHPRLLKN